MNADFHFDFDPQELIEAVRLYSKAYPQKDGPEIVNRAADNIAFRSASKTKVTAKGKLTKHHPDRGVRSTYAKRLHYAKTAKKGVTTGRKAAAVKSWNKSEKSRGYGRAGWLAVLRKRGKATRVAPSSQLIAKAESKKAVSGSLKAVVGNPANGVENFGAPAMQWAVAFVSNDMKTHALKKLSARARQYSGR